MQILPISARSKENSLLWYGVVWLKDCLPCSWLANAVRNLICSIALCFQKAKKHSSFKNGWHEIAIFMVIQRNVGYLLGVIISILSLRKHKAASSCY